jgi:hypothetical protein
MRVLEIMKVILYVENGVFQYAIADIPLKLIILEYDRDSYVFDNPTHKLNGDELFVHTIQPEKDSKEIEAICRELKPLESQKDKLLPV